MEQNQNKTIGWNMLDSYSEGQAIFGRDSEILAIKESVQYNVQTFLYGKSGIGKTSLLQAGIFPELRKCQFFPVVIRLTFYKNTSLNNVVKRLVQEEAERDIAEFGKVPLTCSLIDEIDISTCTLYEYFSKVKFEDCNQTPYIPVLIFDQFEESINNEENWQRTVDFLKEELYDLMDNSHVIHGESLPYTNYRIVFSMREDYLYYLEDIIDRYGLWELRYNRFRVKSLSDDKAVEVILRTSGRQGLESGREENIANTIIKIVKDNSGARFTEINTALLSLICSLLHQNAVNNCICYNDLRKINVYLNSFYDSICDEIGWSAAEYLEARLLTKDGRRSSIDETEVLDSKKITQKQLECLVDKRFLRRIKTDNTSIRYEYIHDLFAKMIFKRRMDEKERRLKPELFSVSKRLDRKTFFRKFTVTTILILLLGYIFDLAVYILKYGEFTFNIFDFTIKYHLGSGLISFVLLVYLIPLLIKRLHDAGRSGWWITLCGLFPTIYILLLRNGFNLPIGIWNEYLAIIGSCISVALTGFLCIKPSVISANPAKYSKEYEAIYKGSTITNTQFAKSLLLELSLWIVNYCIIKMSTFIISYWSNLHHSNFNPNFSLNYKEFYIFQWLGSDFAVPWALALFPIALYVSPSLKARVKAIGYPNWLTYIPYINVLLLFVCLLPDNFLFALGLWRTPKQPDKSFEQDAYVDILNSFIYIPTGQDGLIRYSGHVVEKRNIILAMSFIPFYAVIRMFRRKLPTRNRLIACAFVGVNIFVMWLLFVLLLFIYENSENNIVSENLLNGFLYITIVVELTFFLIIPWWNKLVKKEIISTIKNTPNCDDSVIFSELKDYVPKKQINNTVKKLQENGYIRRVELDGKLCYKLDVKRCSKYIKL